MQLTPWRSILAGVLPLLLAGPALAQAEEEPSLSVEMVNNEDGKGSACRLLAKTQKLPNGAQLTVTISARGKTRDYMCRMKKVVVANSSFAVEETWPDRQFAPLLYVVKVELDVRKQSHDVKSWLQTEYGYPQTHRAALHDVKKVLGTDEQRAAFALKNLNEIEALCTRLQELLEIVKTLTAKPANENPDYRTQQKAAYKEFGSFRNDVDAHFKSYVILLEQGLYKRLQRGVAKISRLVRDFGRGRARNVDKAINGFALEFASNVQLVRRMKPADSQDPLIPDGKEDGEE